MSKYKLLAITYWPAALGYLIDAGGQYADLGIMVSLVMQTLLVAELREERDTDES